MSSTESTLYDFRIICRSCSRISKKLIPLDKPYNEFTISKSELVDARITIRTVMMSCANVQVNSDDGLPQKVCTRCVLSIRAAFNYRRMCEQSDTELRQMLQQHLATATLKLHKIDGKNDSLEENCSADKQSEPIEADSDNDTASEVVAEPIEEIIWEPTPPASVVDDARDSGPKMTDTPPVVVEPLPVANEFDASPPLTLNETITRDESAQENDGSDDSFERYEKWEQKQKLKRKKLLSEKMKRIIASKSNGKPKAKHVRKYMCEICSKFFENIKAHRSVHKSERNYECDICKRIYKMKGSLSEHMQWHIHGVSCYRHLCPMCGNKYRCSNKLAEHMRLHNNEKPFKCENCDKAFETKQKLRSHSLTHLSIKPHVCSVCGKGFSMRQHWKFHMMMHAGDRPHKCSICGATFPRASTLKIHMRGHSGAVPYDCKVCGENFRESRQLTKHQQTSGHLKTY